MNKIAIILCAGKQSRFKSDLPKALAKYKNTTEILSQVLSNLTSAKAKLNRMKKKIDEISMFSKTATSFIDKLSVDINKLN